MKKETFESILKAILKQHDVDMKLNDAYREAQLDTYFVGTTINEIYQAFDKVFVERYGTEGLDLIQWWRYEAVDKLLFDENEDVVADLTDIDNFYEYMENEYV